jgi:hypothetical protein
VLGYSVTRGQGLAEPEKFSTQARDWLERALGRPWRLEVLAHSRAVIAPDDAHDGEPSLADVIIVPRFTRAPGCRHRVLSARLPN